MSTPYTIRRTMRGDLQALSVIALGFDRRELHITTDKGSRGITCDATVYRITADGMGREHAFGLGRPGSGDFRRQLAAAPGARATEKAITTMHAGSTPPDAVAALVADVRKFYGITDPTPAAMADMDETAGVAP